MTAHTLSAPPIAPVAEAVKVPSRAPRSQRLLGALLAAACLAVLIAASLLSPDAAGSGTHTQLGLPPCGFYLATGYPCPTCGMTTAFAHMAHGHPGRALACQPFGAVLAVIAAVLFWGGLHVAVFGSNLGRIAGRLLAPRVLWVIGAAALGAWAYKIAITRTSWPS